MLFYVDMPVPLLCEDDQTLGAMACLLFARACCSDEGLSTLVETCEPHPDREDSRDIRLFSVRILQMAAKVGR
jgi:hypothetical protein